MHRDRRHTTSRNIIIILFRESILCLHPSDGGVVLPIASSHLLREESEGKKVGSLLSAVPPSPAEGGVDVEDEASGLEGGVGGGSPASMLSLANG